VRWEGPELAPGKHVLEFDFKYDGLGPGTMAFNNYSGVGRGGTGVLKVDGQVVATQKMEHTLPFILQWDEALDIGSDTGSPVNDADYKTPFDGKRLGGQHSGPCIERSAGLTQINDTGLRRRQIGLQRR
jgi:arylsulfatase